MGQDEVLKIVAGIVVAVLVVAFVIYVVNSSQEDIDTMDDPVNQMGQISNAIPDLAE